MGLGLHGGGVEVAKFFYGQGAEILVTDLKPAEKLTESLEKLKKYKKIKYTLGKHQEKDFLWPDLIIKNPDVANSSPYLQIARKHKIPIETDVGLFFKYSNAFIIGVTGTKGKSTTASLIYHILKSKFSGVLLGGNIGVSPLALLSKVKPKNIVILELSSFELEDLKQSPNIAVIINIMPDHLNRYATMQEYIEAKKQIFKFQKKNDVLILNADNFIVRQMTKEAPSKIVFSLPKESLKGIDIKGVKILGKHNLENISSAIEVAKILKIPLKNIEKSIKTFKGVHSRQELVGEINGVKYINDTTATMPDATTMAINTFLEDFPDSRLILICGGVDKGLRYDNLSKLIGERVDEVFMLPGTASDKIKEGLGNYTRVHDIPSMQEAVKQAKKLAKKGDVVILSPAAASFNLFKNEFDRGDQFVKAVKNEKKV